MTTRIRIKYVRSAIGRTKRQKDTIAALGLRQLGSHCWLSPTLAADAAALELAPA